MWDALPSLSRVGRSHPLRQPICTIETQVLKQLLSGLGELSAFKEYIGYDAYSTGLFQHNGGTNTATFLSIGTSGKYIFSGGNLNINAGFESQGILDFNNGSGVVLANNAIINFAQGGSILNASSATLTIGSNSLLIVPNN